MKKIRVALACYRIIAVPAILITLIESYLIVVSGSFSFVQYALSFKVATTGLLFIFIHLFRSHEFYFFNNLGYSARMIYGSMIVIEFFVTGLCFLTALSFI